jgi:hypothetical protein
MGPTQPPMQSIQLSLPPREKCLGVTLTSPLSIADVEEMWIYNVYSPPIRVHGIMLQ